MSRQSPFEGMEEWFERMSKQFEEAAQWWDREDMFPSAGAAPSIDLVDRTDEFLVTVDLPGFTSDDVEVEITDQTLSVEAERSSETESEDETFLRRERHHASMSRTIRLPAEVEADDVSASMTDGVLTITIPKAEPTTEGRRIEIT